MDPIDVILLTKNSEQVLEGCLRSIYRNVPVERLIVVDNHSVDNTMDILRRFDERYHNVVILHDSGTRATARQKGIANVETEWFMFVDSDVVLCQDWYEKALNYVNSDVGSVWGIEVWSTIKNRTTLKLFLWITRKIFELRGGTHDTLVRTCLVKDIKIPRDLHVFEDAYIRDWIVKKGYRAVACYNPFCVHFRPESIWTLKGNSNTIAEAIRCGESSLISKLIPAYGFYAVYSIYRLFNNRAKRS
jgi:glycosyltransferase involved in cell wall biosynthesis